MERYSPPEHPERLRRVRTIIRLGALAIKHTFNDIEKLINHEQIVFTDAWWERVRSKAGTLMKERQAQPGATLLVVAAQHPLKHGREPGEEFAVRLIAAAARAKELDAQGRQAIMYVPGSRHKHNGTADDIPLAQAGTAFLQALPDLPACTEFHGNDLNEQYKGKKGVYNSGDEAFVSARFFKEHDHLHSMEVFCSPGQAKRWELHAVANGVVPVLHTVTPPSGESHHANKVGQNTLLAYTRKYDPTWQGQHSLLGTITRTERQP